MSPSLPDRAPQRSLTSAAAQRLAQQRGAASPWSTAMREVEAVDLAMYEAVARTPTPSLDTHLRRLSAAANYSRLWFGIAAAIALGAGQRGRRAAFDGVLTIGVTSASVNLVAKSIAVRQRPDVEASRRFSAREVEMPESWSFPSGHAASASAFAYAVGRHLPELAVPLTLAAGAVGYSRVHIGVHYPGDVVVGSMLGSGVAAMIASASDRLTARGDEPELIGGRRGRTQRRAGRTARVRARGRARHPSRVARRRLRRTARSRDRSRRSRGRQ